MPQDQTRRFARDLARRGYVTLTQRWFHEGYCDPATPHTAPLAERYGGSVARFAAEAPHCKGLRRAIADAARSVDYLQTLDLVDASRIGCMGHSLGGKLTLYAAAFEDRLTAAVASELGVGIRQSNWEAPWYLGPEVCDPEFPLDHHQLLAMIVPRPFLLIAGEDADGDRSWAYLNSARKVYRLFTDQPPLAMVNHRSGHTPVPEAVERAYQWLEHWL